MYRLTATNQILRAVLAGAHTTTAPLAFTNYSDLHTSVSPVTYIGGNTVIPLNGATPVTIVGSPAASTIRDVDQITIYNADTVNAVVTLSHYDGATNTPILKATLATLDTLHFAHGVGWQVTDSNGRIKMAATPTSLDATATPITNITTAMFAANIVDIDGTLAANSDTRLASQKAVKTYRDAGLPTSALLDLCTVAQKTVGSNLGIYFDNTQRGGYTLNKVSASYAQTPGAAAGSAANGDAFAVSVCLAAGLYDFIVYGVATSNAGKVDLNIDGGSVVGTVNGNGGGTFNTATKLDNSGSGITWPGGTHVINFVINGSDNAGFEFWLSQMAIRKHGGY